MPYKDLEIKKKYHRQYMGEYKKTHPMTDEQKAKKAEYMRAWNAKNKAKVRETSRLSYLKNKDKRQEKGKEYRAKNAEIIKAKKHEYYVKNKELFLERSKKYYKENLSRIREYKNIYTKTGKSRFITYQVSAKKRGHMFLLTEHEFLTLFNSPCHYCNEKASRGIDRKNSNIGYTKENSLPCCKDCNYMKRDSSYEDFIIKIKAIYKNLL